VVRFGTLWHAAGQADRRIQQRAREKLKYPDCASDLRDLMMPPSNQLEGLKGDRQGQHSIRIDKQWRVCFTWKDGDAFDVENADRWQRSSAWLHRRSMRSCDVGALLQPRWLCGCLGTSERVRNWAEPADAVRPGDCRQKDRQEGRARYQAFDATRSD
jgi:toxin HigB-1